MRKLILVFIAAVIFLSMVTVYADDRAIWDSQVIFDDFDNGILNTTIWTVLTSGSVGTTHTVTESGGKMNIFCSWGASQVCAAESYANTTNLPRIEDIFNVTVKVNLINSFGINDCVGTISFFHAYSHTIIALTGNGAVDSSVWLLQRNITNPTYFDVYNDSVFAFSFQPVGTNAFDFNANGGSSGSQCPGSTVASVDYIYYAIYNSTMNITINYPAQNANLYTEQTASFNITASTTNGQLKNITLYIDDVAIDNQSWTGRLNNTLFIEDISNLSVGSHSWYARVCDSDGNCKFSEVRTFNNLPFSSSIDFQNSVLEGVNQTIGLNLTFNPARYSTVNAFLVYDNVSYAASSVIGNGSANFTVNLNAPIVVSDRNVTFYWNITMQNATGTENVNNGFQMQTVVNALIDDCSAQHFLIANFTFYDEDSLTRQMKPAYNLSASVEAYIYSNDGELIANLSFNRTSMDSIALCISALPATPVYFFSTIRYGVILPATYVTKYWNVQSFPLTTISTLGNISLYNLLATSSTEFLITLKDENYNRIDGALIDVRRRFTSPSVPVSIEIIKTDSSGQAISHFVLNDFRYDFVVSKDNVTLYTFKYMQPFCSDVSTGNCQFELKIPSIGERPIQEGIPITITKFSYNKFTRLITVDWANNDGNQHTLYLNVTTMDNSTEMCSGTTSAGYDGTLFCSVPSSFGNVTALVRVQENENVYLSQHVNLGGDTIDNNVLIVIGDVLILVVVTLITLPAGFVPTIIVFCIGLIVVTSLGLFGSGGVIGVSSAVIWFIIAALILIWRASKNERV